MIVKMIVENALEVMTPSAPPTGGVNTAGLADFLRRFFAPLFLVVVSVVAIFFLFTREITRFVQFIILQPRTFLDQLVGIQPVEQLAERIELAVIVVEPGLVIERARLGLRV